MSQGLKYNVDVVLCIDATGSMSSIIEKVKDNALKFHEDLMNKMDEKGKKITQLRVKVIAFRDFYFDGTNSIKESEFFNLPEQSSVFSDFVHSIRAEGGGDEPECGLEALALAMKSDWTRDGDKRRQIIVVWTDASTHPLEKNNADKPSSYPNDIPKNFNELTDWWQGQTAKVNNSEKRLIVYAPDADDWNKTVMFWNNVLHFPSQAGNGLKEVEYGEILDTVASSC